MANTATFSSKPSNNSDADFRAWASALSAALETVGLTRVTGPKLVADNSDVSAWSSVSKPASGSTYAVFDIFRFNDDLQTDNPVFFRIEYGAASNATQAGLKLIVGSSYSELDFTINSSPKTPDIVIACTGNDTANNYTSFISSNGGRVSLALWAACATVGVPIGLYIERTKDDSGLPTADGISIVSCATLRHQFYMPASGALYPATAANAQAMAYMCAAPAYGGSYDANYTGIYPVYPNRGYAGNPDLGGLVYFQADIGAGSTTAVTIYGTEHTYVALGTCKANNINGNATANSLLIRYE